MRISPGNRPSIGSFGTRAAKTPARIRTAPASIRMRDKEFISMTTVYKNRYWICRGGFSRRCQAGLKCGPRPIRHGPLQLFIGRLFRRGRGGWRGRCGGCGGCGWRGRFCGFFLGFLFHVLSLFNLHGFGGFCRGFWGLGSHYSCGGQRQGQDSGLQHYSFVHFVSPFSFRFLSADVRCLLILRLDC